MTPFLLFEYTLSVLAAMLVFILIGLGMMLAISLWRES